MGVGEGELCKTDAQKNIVKMMMMIMKPNVELKRMPNDSGLDTLAPKAKWLY